MAELRTPNFLGSMISGLQAGRESQVLRAKQAQEIAAAQERQTLNQMIQSGALTTEEGRNALLKAPGGLPILEAYGKLQEQSSKATQEETKSLEGRMQYWRRLIPADARLAPAWVEAAYADPIVGSQLSQLGSKEDVIAGIPRDPEGYMRWAEGASMFADKLSERRTLTAEQREAITTQRRGQDIQAATTRRGQDIERDTKERAQNLERFFGATGAGTEDRKVVARTETAADGTVRFYNKFGDLLKTEKGAGKPSATFEKTKATREQTQRDLSSALSTLNEIVKPGGLIDQSTGSLAGKGVDILARTGGFAMEGDIALGKLQVLSDQILKLVPRFEGPQSDKDTQSYREASGQLADGTLPRKIRKAAAKTLIDLYTRRQGQFTIQGAETNTGGDWQDL
jgi:hypothetical protein